MFRASLWRPARRASQQQRHRKTGDIPQAALPGCAPDPSACTPVCPPLSRHPLEDLRQGSRVPEIPQHSPGESLTGSRKSLNHEQQCKSRGFRQPDGQDEKLEVDCVWSQLLWRGGTVLHNPGGPLWLICERPGGCPGQNDPQHEPLTATKTTSQGRGNGKGVWRAHFFPHSLGAGDTSFQGSTDHVAPLQSQALPNIPWPARAVTWPVEAWVLHSQALPRTPHSLPRQAQCLRTLCQPAGDKASDSRGSIASAEGGHADTDERVHNAAGDIGCQGTGERKETPPVGREGTGPGSRHWDAGGRLGDPKARTKDTGHRGLLRLLPAPLLPYARLARADKPIGTWLLAWPCFWSIALATPPGTLPELHLLALFGLGAFLMRGAGCTVNDILDKDFDSKVERTKSRPLAAGDLTTRAALVFLGGQLLMALGVLLQLNTFSQVLGAASLPLVFTYPLMKRVTDWPQAYLGLAFNWGALLGWAAVQGSLDLNVVLPLYLGGVCWTLVYDTIYAHQDKEDDAIVGVRSTARLFGEKTQVYLSGFGIATVSMVALAGYNAGLGTPFLLAMAAPTAHIAWQVLMTDFNDSDDCLKKFKSSSTFGALVLGAITLGKWL